MLAAGKGQCLAPVAGTCRDDLAALKRARGKPAGDREPGTAALERTDGIGRFDLQGEMAADLRAHRLASDRR